MRRPASLSTMVCGAAVGWLMLLAVAPQVYARHDAWPADAWWATAGRASAGLVYVAGSYVCHQRPERSFHLAGAPLPVCARCVGVYAGAVIGLAAFVLASSGQRARLARHARSWLALAAAPTVLSVGLEWMGAGSPLWTRTVTMLPPGALAAALFGLALDGWARGVAPHQEGGRQGSATLL